MKPDTQSIIRTYILDAWDLGLSIQPSEVPYLYESWPLFSSHGSSEIKLVGQSDPVFAHQNYSVILPCYLEPRSSAEDMIVEWTRTDQPGKVCVYIDPHITVEHPAYEGRASMSLEEVKKGNLSLTLKQIKIVDAGTYTCRLPRENKETTIQLKVESIDEDLKKLLNENKKLLNENKKLLNENNELRNKAVGAGAEVGILVGVGLLVGGIL